LHYIIYWSDSISLSQVAALASSLAWFVTNTPAFASSRIRYEHARLLCRASSAKLYFTEICSPFSTSSHLRYVQTAVGCTLIAAAFPAIYLPLDVDTLVQQFPYMNLVTLYVAWHLTFLVASGIPYLCK
jgi:hypothetical protein